jgi:hypothetical protein
MQAGSAHEPTRIQRAIMALKTGDALSRGCLAMAWDLPQKPSPKCLRARMLRCGNHPLNLWITLWVNGLNAAPGRVNAWVCTICCIFEQQIYI